jgi:hypothetical protein
MPVNTETCRRYRDTWAAPGSALFEAITNRQHKRALRIYRQCAVDAGRLLKPKRKRKQA